MTNVMCTLALSIAAALGMARQEPGTVSRSLRLEPGAAVTQQIALGGKDSYAIAVAPGQFLRVVIVPAGVDLTLALAAPDGSPLVTIDAARSHAPASISIEADPGGDYTLTARAIKEAPSAGSYAVRVEIRVPTSVLGFTQKTLDSFFQQYRALAQEDAQMPSVRA